MNENRISIEIPALELENTIQKLKEVEAFMSQYLIALTPDERHDLPKMGDKTAQFVEKACEHAQNNAELLPSYIALDEWKRDIKARQDLRGLLALCEKLRSNLDDTMLLCGSESFTAALGFYNNVKQAAKMNVPSAKAVQADLAPRFPGRNSISAKQAVV